MNGYRGKVFRLVIIWKRLMIPEGFIALIKVRYLEEWTAQDRGETFLSRYG